MVPTISLFPSLHSSVTRLSRIRSRMASDRFWYPLWAMRRSKSPSRLSGIDTPKRVSPGIFPPFSDDLKGRNFGEILLFQHPLLPGSQGRIEMGQEPQRIIGRKNRDA